MSLESRATKTRQRRYKHLKLRSCVSYSVGHQGPPGNRGKSLPSPDRQAGRGDRQPPDDELCVSGRDRPEGRGAPHPRRPPGGRGVLAGTYAMGRVSSGRRETAFRAVDSVWAKALRSHLEPVGEGTPQTQVPCPLCLLCWAQKMNVCFTDIARGQERLGVPCLGSWRFVVPDPGRVGGVDPGGSAGPEPVPAGGKEVGIAFGALFV